MYEGNGSKKFALDRGCFTASGKVEASVATANAMLFRARGTSFGKKLDYTDNALTKRDIAILQFLAATELIESDLWQQYDEVGGATKGPQNNYQLALQFLGGSSSQYISVNAISEIEHSTFLKTFLESEGVEPINLDAFRILRGSTAAGAQNMGRLTNLMHLNINTNRYIRYGSAERPRLTTASPQAFQIVNSPAIPRTDSDFDDTARIQAIANTAAFHFRYIEEGVSSLYTSLSQKVKRAKVLKITLGIGGQEIAHLLEWIEFASSAFQCSPFSFGNLDPSITEQGMNLSDPCGFALGPVFKAKLQFSSGDGFIHQGVPISPVISSDHRFSSAVATINSFIDNGLFFGQSAKFLRTLMTLSEEADAAFCS